MKNKFLILSFLAALLLFGESLLAQKVRQPIERKSPLGLATFMGEDGTYLKVTYGQPRKKGRNIFGELVPYGELWRTGANEATEITITEDVKIIAKIWKQALILCLASRGLRNGLLFSTKPSGNGDLTNTKR